MYGIADPYIIHSKYPHAHKHTCTRAPMPTCPAHKHTCPHAHKYIVHTYKRNFIKCSHKHAHMLTKYTHAHHMLITCSHSIAKMAPPAGHKSVFWQCWISMVTAYPLLHVPHKSPVRPVLHCWSGTSNWNLQPDSLPCLSQLT